MTPALLPLFAIAAAGGLLEIDDGALSPASPSAWDRTGEAVATRSERAVVGARWDDSAGTDAGAVYLYRRVSDVWALEDTILAPDAAPVDQFGSSVAIDGEILVVGAPTVDTLGSNDGAVYVFFFTGAVWLQQAKLFASDGDTGDRFGTSVAVQGDRIVVGAMGNADNGSYTGSAYVFVWNGTQWNEQAKLLASNGSTERYFGTTVAIDQDTAVVGAPGVGGAAYVFVDAGAGVWNEQAILVNASVSSFDRFGESVSLDGDLAAIGAPLDDDNGTDSGSVILFDRAGTAWSQGQTLVAGEQSGELGASVSLRGGVLAAGAPGDHHLGDDPLGAVYLFSFDGGIWGQGGQIAPAGLEAWDEYGAAVSFDGDVLIVGIPGLDEGAVNAGGAHAYRIVPGPELYCFGDGISSPCPCGNEAAPGVGCVNSTGAGAVLDTFGHPSISADELTFDGVGMVPGQAALLFAGLNAINGGAGIFFGDGLRCAGGGIVRLGVKVPDGSGSASWGPGLLEKLDLQPADTRRFQAWYRDPVGGPCGNGFNLSNGAEIVFVP